MSITDFGTRSDGRAVGRVTLENGSLSASFLTLGALIHEVRLEGVAHSLTLGGETPRDYEGVMEHFGAIMGPVANRITDARAMIDGTEFSFDANQDGRHTLHGGSAATHTKLWQVADHDARSVTFALDLPDGEGGFPGRRRIEATYTLDPDALVLELRAATDRPTLMNLASHGYWTMQPPGDWSGQRLQILADRYLPTDDANLPTGEIADVAGTAYDFREPRLLDAATAPKLDHNFCLSDAPRDLSPALRLSGPEGLTLEISTTAPGMQVFGMGSFAVDEATLHGRGYPRFAALAFEPQHWPDAPTHPAFPAVLLRPGTVYTQTSRFAFSR
ncbi:galactose mutarotase [Maribius pontilimi]|uniref:Galactose mutarotase n=1 Tax=Palleronia pontilimi TaxID=1964209 RepID=A0A934MCE0_9RHOB|nr:aldose epimerase family protein [Palleronia pontilimi]MBJ3762405.1 galactose mutarotase [Palleronia pontilimi]